MRVGFFWWLRETHLQKVISRSEICAVVIDLGVGQNSQGEETHTHAHRERS